MIFRFGETGLRFLKLKMLNHSLFFQAILNSLHKKKSPNISRVFCNGRCCFQLQEIYPLCPKQPRAFTSVETLSACGVQHPKYRCFSPPPDSIKGSIVKYLMMRFQRGPQYFQAVFFTPIWLSTSSIYTPDYIHLIIITVPDECMAHLLMKWFIIGSNEVQHEQKSNYGRQMYCLYQL